MQVLTLADFIEGVAGQRPTGGDRPVHPVIDSRQAEPGAIFFAFRGERVDGHHFVADALSRGAVAAVIDEAVESDVPLLDLRRPLPDRLPSPPLLLRVESVLSAMQRAAAFWRSRFQVRVIGITGSVGKTTTKETTAQVLAQRYRVLKTEGSQNNEIGLPLTLLRLTGEHERVVLEMGMYTRGDIRALAEIARPQVGVVTNVEPVHAERAGSLEAIALAKRELVEALPPAPEGIAILNDDDPRVRVMAAYTEARPFFYGLTPRADLWADEVESLGLEGIRFRLHYGDEAVYLRAPLLGRHSVHAVLRAVAVALNEGLGWEEIARGLREESAQLRLVAVRGPHGTLILDDTYNASPPSALAALNLLEELNGARKIAVLGDMLELGDYEEEGHLKVGCRAAAVADLLIAVGERAHLLRRGATLCGMELSRIREVATPEEAVAFLKGILQAEDVILVKGSHALRMDRIVAALTEA